MEIVDLTERTRTITHNLEMKAIYSQVGTPAITERLPHLNGVIYNRSRSLTRVDGIMLHQMGFDRGNAPSEYLRIIGHYAVLRDGTILKLRDHEAFLNDARSGSSIHVEFAGNYPDESVASPTSTPTLRQIRSGRWLMRVICESPGLHIRHVVSHRQWNFGGRPNDPGPHLWFNVAVWAKSALGLTGVASAANGRDNPASWESSRFDIDATGFGNRAGWTVLVRAHSRAIGVKIHGGGIIGIYGSPAHAEAEKAQDQVWPRGSTFESWLVRRSEAVEVELMDGGVVGFYQSSAAAARESARGVSPPRSPASR